MIQLSISQDVAYISLNNPPANCLTIELMDELVAKLEHCKANSVRAIVLRSTLEGVFCAGIDPQAVLSASIAKRKDIFRNLAALINCCLNLGIPIITDINGSALAGGAVLAVLADFAVMHETFGKICFSEIKVRLSVPRSIQTLVAAKVPPGSLTEILVLGKNIPATEATQIGLANCLYTSETEKQDLIQTYLSKIARLDPVPMAQTLLDLKQPLREAMKNFEAELVEFAKFLTDDYLGKGLREISLNQNR